MPRYESTETVPVRASAQDCFDVLTDYERIPEWQGPVKRCDVIERDDHGRGTLVEYAIDARLRTVTYKLRHRYDEPHAITSSYAGGDFRAMDGEYLLDERSDAGATSVTFRLRIVPGFLVPRRVASMLEEQVMRRALEDLRRHVESMADAA